MATVAYSSPMGVKEWRCVITGIRVGAFRKVCALVGLLTLSGLLLILAVQRLRSSDLLTDDSSVSKRIVRWLNYRDRGASRAIFSQSDISMSKILVACHAAAMSK